MGKKDRCTVFGCDNDHLFTERVPPVHPIILLKSNKFNMAAESVKRSIIIKEGPGTIRHLASTILNQ